ncbi:uncharacterized protein LOC9657096 [Selaginella moellendorffii]|nr:uncharacterized protein LOC9657096 [Selaginella moellendorffii]|eukprot:XP_002974177.2 uncharacterized protein LOC9657096 [Selaginella moellendorffii]
MADTVGSILDYLRQHHFLQAEAALKAELAGREVSNGLFSIDVDLGVQSNKVPAKELAEDASVPSDVQNEKLLVSEVADCQRNSTLVKYYMGVPKSTEQTTSASVQAGPELEVAEDKRRATGSAGTENAAKVKVVGESSLESSNEGFWEQKDELLWVPGTKQGPQLGKVHPLDELGFSQGRKSSQTHNDQKHKGAARHKSMEARSERSGPESTDEPQVSNIRSTRKEAAEDGKPEESCLASRPTSSANSSNQKGGQDKARGSGDGSERSSGFPRLPPVRLKSVEKIPDEWVAHCRVGSDADVEMDPLDASSFALGSFLDVPVGQDILSSGTKRCAAINRPSVSHGIVEDPSASFANAGDGSAAEYPDEYWDSDAYEDDDDPGYTRRPIDDEKEFLASEINYPSEEERARIEHNPAQQGTTYGKYDDDDRSYVESYFSGEEYYRGRDARDNNGDADVDALCGAADELSFRPHANDYDGQLLDSEELKQIRSEPAWQGFVVQGNAIRKDQAATTANDQDDFSREIRETYLAESSDGEVGSLQDCDFQGRNGFLDVEKRRQQCFKQGGPSSAEEEHDIVLQYYNRPWGHKAQANGCEEVDRNGSVETQLAEEQLGAFQFGGFSFPSPSSAGDVDGSRAESGRSLWSTREISSRGEEVDQFANGFVGPDDTLASWKRKSNESSPIISGGEDHELRLALSTHSTVSPGSTEDSLSVEEERVDDEDVDAQRDETEAAAAYDEEAIAVHEHFHRLQAEEEEFETFDLKIIHRKNRTGFEEDKDFQVLINSVIAGRYHVTEFLGAAAFSKAIQAHDLFTGMDVCMKIIKNNKDFFDQSLDEIKLLKYINKHDPADKYHILRLYDYFYHREHLFIVCELLRANLYEFHKYNRDSGGEVYFTMPRLQSITRQCLEALEFLHGLGLIHCDLKPENILVKSYSRCEVKVIDLGSSCFQSDHLCSYVQSRSYRAPEVILGLPYDQKIDIWSLGCILAELCSGNVLFQNDSLATLLARVVGIIGPLDPEMVARGRESYKFLTKNGKLYERNQETSRMEYLIPKKTTLAHRLPMGDQGFLEFVAFLLQINPKNRPSAAEALKHPWLSYPYEPISS